jgi:hypothetical protein
MTETTQSDGLNFFQQMIVEDARRMAATPAANNANKRRELCRHDASRDQQHDRLFRSHRRSRLGGAMTNLMRLIQERVDSRRTESYIKRVNNA